MFHPSHPPVLHGWFGWRKGHCRCSFCVRSTYSSTQASAVHHRIPGRANYTCFLHSDMLVKSMSRTYIFSLTPSPHYTPSIMTLRKTTSSCFLPFINNPLFFTGVALQSPVTGSRGMLVSRVMKGPTLQLDSLVQDHESLLPCFEAPPP